MACGQHSYKRGANSSQRHRIMWLNVLKSMGWHMGILDERREDITTSSTPNLEPGPLQTGTDSRTWKGMPVRELGMR